MRFPYHAARNGVGRRRCAKMPATLRADGNSSAREGRAPLARRHEMAGGRGFEPRLTESESAVLPLNYPPMGRRPDRMHGGAGQVGASVGAVGPGCGAGPLAARWAAPPWLQSVARDLVWVEIRTGRPAGQSFGIRCEG